MSASKPIALSAKARADLRDIEVYTMTHWDARQWAAYEAAIASALTNIGDNPEIGRARDEIHPGYRSYVVGQHLIFYRITPRVIVVIGILSARKNLHRALRGRL